MDWLARIPPWIKLFSAVAGYLVGAFSGRLPDGFQDIGLVVGLVIGTIALVGLLRHFLGEASNRRDRPMSMIPEAMMLLGALLFTFGAYFYIEQKRPHVEGEQPSPREKSNRTLRFAKGQNVDLRDLLTFDFPNASFVQSRRFEVGRLANAWFADFITMYPSKVRAEFYVVTIPENANAYAVSEYVGHNYQQLREDQEPAESRLDRKLPKGAERLGISEEIMKNYIGEKLPFTGQIYIYHEPRLSDAQIKTLANLYRQEGVIVEFRGPEHIAQMWADHGPRED